MYRDELFEGDQREEEERVDQVQIIDILLIWPLILKKFEATWNEMKLN